MLLDLARIEHADTEPRHVEAAMRSTHGTLDHLGEPGHRQKPTPEKTDRPLAWSVRPLFLGTYPPAAGLLPGSVTFSVAPTETLDEAHSEIRSIAEELFALEDRLRRVWGIVPSSLDEDASSRGGRRETWRRRSGRMWSALGRS